MRISIDNKCFRLLILVIRRYKGDWLIKNYDIEKID